MFRPPRRREWRASLKLTAQCRVVKTGSNNLLCDATAGARSTFVAATGLPGKAYKQWIAGALSPGGSLSIDDGAVAALAAGKSLLPGGVVSVGGEFDRGACLRILDRHGREVARGISAHGAAESRMIKGRGSAHIAELLGYAGPDELIHRDDLVVL